MMLAKPEMFDLVPVPPSGSAQQLFELHLVESGVNRAVLAIKDSGAGYVNPDIQGMWEIFLNGGEG